MDMMIELTETELNAVAGGVFGWTFNSTNTFTGQGQLTFTHNTTVTDRSFSETNNSSGTLIAAGTGGSP
jgi:hypothetical protein